MESLSGFWSLIGTTKISTCLTSCKNWHTAKHLSAQLRASPCSLLSQQQRHWALSQHGLVEYHQEIFPPSLLRLLLSSGVGDRQQKGSAFSRSSPGVVLDFSFVFGRARSCCHLPAPQSCLKDAEPGQVIEVFNWRVPDPPELQCTGGSHWLAACGAKPSWVSFLQCGAALALTWEGPLAMSEGYQWSLCGLLGPS